MRQRRIITILLRTLIIVACSIVLIGAGIVWFIKSDNMRQLVEKLIPDYIHAEVRMKALDISGLTNFPRLTVEVDSVVVIPRIPGNRNCDTLLKAQKLEAGFNLFKISADDVNIDMIKADGLDVTLQEYADSTNNWDIIPRSLKHKMKPNVSFGKINVGKSMVSYNSAIKKVDVKFKSKNIGLSNDDQGQNDYKLNLSGDVNLAINSKCILKDMPLRINGPISFSIPKSYMSTTDCKLDIGSLRAVLTTKTSFKPEIKIDALDFMIQELSLGTLLEQLPVTVPEVKGLNYRVNLCADISLLKPYKVSRDELPAFSARVIIPDGDIRYYGNKRDTVTVSSKVNLIVSTIFDGKHPELTDVDIERLTLEAEGTEINVRGRIERIMAVNSLISASADIKTSLTTIGKLCGLHQNVTMSGDVESHINLSLNPRRALASAKTSGSVDVKDVRINIGERHNIATDSVNVKFDLAKAGEDCRAKVLVKDISYVSGRRFKARIDKLNANASVSPQGGFGQLKGNARKIASTLNIKGNTLASGGEMYSVEYPAKVKLGQLAATFSDDVLTVNQLSASTQSTSLTVRGVADGIINKSTDVSPLKIRANVDFDTLDINQMSHVFRRGAGKHKLIPAEVRAHSVSDLHAVRMPKWIDLNAGLNIATLKCVNVAFHNFGGSCVMVGGNLHIPDLHASTPFANAGAKVDFLTANPYDISLQLGIGVEKFDMSHLLNTFPKLKKHIPELSDVQAHADLNINCGLSTFPDMIINLPSVEGDVTLKATNMSLPQVGKIHRIARLLLIREPGEITIDDFTAHFHIGDNRVTLDPLSLNVDRYSFNIEGFNDFSSEMYYHAAVLNSPVPFKFGINLYGSDGKYKVRFGGPKFDENNSLRKNEIMTDQRVNMITQLKYYLGKLVDAAAHKDMHK